jgi:hypothetical protein
MEGCRHEPPPALEAIPNSLHRVACHLDQGTRDARGAEMASAGAVEGVAHE